MKKIILKDSHNHEVIGVYDRFDEIFDTYPAIEVVSVDFNEGDIIWYC